MDINTAKSFMESLIRKAPEYGFEDSECSFGSSSSMEINILNGEVQSYERSSEQGISFAGKKNGQLGTASVTDINDDSASFLLHNASQNCDVLDDDDEEFIYCDPDNKDLYYSQITDAFEKNTYKRFAEVGLDLEKSIFDLDPAIKAVDYLSISCDRSFSTKINSKGLNAYRDSDFVSVFAEGRAEVDGIVKTGGYYWYGNDIDKFDKEKFLLEFRKRLMGKFGGTSAGSGTYDIILGNEAMISFLSTFMANFSSYAMQKGISLLAGKEGERIASECFSVREVPMYGKALIKVPFDTEGVITTEKDLIRNGIFVTAFYNLKTANKAGKKSTGNGFKGGISTTNLLIEPGELSFDELCKKVGNGFYITELNGLHAGVNAISGDFSLFCEGYFIEDGKITKAVEQITIADNFYDVLKKIAYVGNDVVAQPDGIGEMFCPSVLIKDISISGESAG